MRSYGQQCAVARALDLVGDRWTLLIVRELMTSGGSRYTDLLAGLPGIATNLLGNRLKEMEANGLVEREEAPPPVATTLFRLSERGEALGPVLAALGAWGMPLLQPVKTSAHFRSRNLRLPLQLYLTTPNDKPITLLVLTGDEPLNVHIAPNSTTARVGAVKNPNLAIKGNPHTVLGLLLKRKSLSEARAAGIQLEGDVTVLDRISVRYLEC